MSSSWLPLWNSNKAAEPVEPATIQPEQSGSAQELEGGKSPDKGTLRSFSSTLTSGNWMNWRKNNKNYLEGNENAIGGDKDEQDEEDTPQDVEDAEQDSPDDDDEIDDHVARDRKKGSWSFWNNSSRDASTSNVSDSDKDKDKTNKNDHKDPPQDKPEKVEKDKKEKDKKLSNTILNSTPTFKNDSNEEGPVDDAVLYKPHDAPKDFNKINTHKNENLMENVIVPNWENCLPVQNSIVPNNSVTSTLFGNSSTASPNNAFKNTGYNKMDVSNWRHFLGQLSTKLGFSSQTLTSVMNDEEVPEESAENSAASKDKLEKEFNLLYEKTYKLFGKSLAKLPSHKRACLPSYNRFYTKSKEAEESYTYSQQSQLEDDATDPNSISITNDPMGNLLINHRPSNKSNQTPYLREPEIVNQKSAPLHKIKKVLIIGVHGFFPTKMIRPLIGAPKGTSLKFANEAEKAVIRYCIENKLINEEDSKDMSIQKIALEKEGKILDRVEFFTEILMKWQEELNAADFIYVASHSQGCVVSIILLAKLIRMGVLKDPIAKRIGILGMAGINNGPFYGVDKSFFMKAYSAIEHDSLMELFELSKFTSEQSLIYKESIQMIINANVKLCLIGSINDQLVPLYSALASHIYHPNIYRACYIDHSSQTPLFIQKLVSLCCQLQNMGYFDNNVLKELSAALAGPMTGGGHSKIYNDGKVYDLGIEFMLDTDDIVIPPTATSKFSNEDSQLITNIMSDPANSSGNGFVTSGVGSFGTPVTESNASEVIRVPVTNQVYIKEFNISKIGTNPFILPWCLRGLLFNIEKNWPNNNKLISVDKGSALGKTGYDEINELYETFDTWKPDGKALKELKFRLNGLRASKL